MKCNVDLYDDKMNDLSLDEDSLLLSHNKIAKLTLIDRTNDSQLLTDHQDTDLLRDDNLQDQLGGMLNDDGNDQCGNDLLNADFNYDAVEDVDDDEENLLKSPIIPHKSSIQGPSWDDYIIDTLLGEGAYGKVFKVFKKKDEQFIRNQQEEQKLRVAKDQGLKSNQGSFTSKSDQVSKVGGVNNNQKIIVSFGTAITNMAIKHVILTKNAEASKPIPYVIKELYTDLMPKNAALQAMEEISILGQLDSPYIVGYIDSFVCEKKVNIIMEFCESGDLQTYLLKKQKDGLPQLPENQIWKFFIQICLGMYYLHSKGILHRDLKSLNIFLTRDIQLKIGDLGVARKLQDQQPFLDDKAQLTILNNSKQCEIDQTTKVGTPYYLAPEIWEGKAYTEKSDMWSLGIILHELCTYQKPFDAEDLEQLKEKVLKQKFREIPEKYSVPKTLQDIIKKLLRKNPVHRPSIRELLQFSSIKTKSSILKIEIPKINLKKQLPKNTVSQSITNFQISNSNYSTNQLKLPFIKDVQNDAPKLTINQIPSTKLISKQALAQKINAGISSHKNSLSHQSQDLLTFKKAIAHNNHQLGMSIDLQDSQHSQTLRQKASQKNLQQLEFSPDQKAIREKYKYKYQGLRKMQLTNQRSLDNLGTMLGQIKQTSKNLNAKRSVQVSKNVSQASFSSVTSINKLQGKGPKKSNQNNTQIVDQAKQETSKIQTSQNQVKKMRNILKLTQLHKPLIDKSPKKQLKTHRVKDSQQIQSTDNLFGVDSTATSLNNIQAAKIYQTNIQNERDSKDDTQIKKLITKVSSRLLQKTKSTTLFRNQATSMRNSRNSNNADKNNVNNNTLDNMFKVSASSQNLKLMYQQQSQHNQLTNANSSTTKITLQAQSKLSNRNVVSQLSTTPQIDDLKFPHNQQSKQVIQPSSTKALKFPIDIKSSMKRSIDKCIKQSQSKKVNGGSKTSKAIDVTTQNQSKIAQQYSKQQSSMIGGGMKQEVKQRKVITNNAQTTIHSARERCYSDKITNYKPMFDIASKGRALLEISNEQKLISKDAVKPTLVIDMNASTISDDDLLRDLQNSSAMLMQLHDQDDNRLLIHDRLFSSQLVDTHGNELLYNKDINSLKLEEQEQQIMNNQTSRMQNFAEYMEQQQEPYQEINRQKIKNNNTTKQNI